MHFSLLLELSAKFLSRSHDNSSASTETFVASPLSHSAGMGSHEICHGFTKQNICARICRGGERDAEQIEGKGRVGSGGGGGLCLYDCAIMQCKLVT